MPTMANPKQIFNSAILISSMSKRIFRQIMKKKIKIIAYTLSFFSKKIYPIIIPIINERLYQASFLLMCFLYLLSLHRSSIEA